MVWSAFRRRESELNIGPKFKRFRVKNNSKNLALDSQRSESSHRKSIDLGQRRILNCMFYSLYDATSPHKSQIREAFNFQWSPQHRNININNSPQNIQCQDKQESIPDSQNQDDSDFSKSISFEEQEIARQDFYKNRFLFNSVADSMDPISKNNENVNESKDSKEVNQSDDNQRSDEDIKEINIELDSDL